MPGPRTGQRRIAGDVQFGLVDGVASLYLDRGGSSLQTLLGFDDPAAALAALRALRSLVEDGRVRELVITRTDGVPVAGSPWRSILLEAGFVPGYRGLVLRGGRRA